MNLQHPEKDGGRIRHPLELSRKGRVRIDFPGVSRYNQKGIVNLQI